ncbi:cytochrome P450 [Thamnidium elegans]|nr:cytochrome P450 [Thamnidium elegans]
MSTKTSLIAVLQTSTNVEKDGVIIQLSGGSTLQTVRTTISKKLGVFVPLDEIMLYNAEKVILEDMEEIRKQQTIYVSVVGGIKTQFPGPRKYPLIGSLYELLPDLVVGFENQFKKHGSLIEAGIFSQSIFSTCDPAVAEAFAKESEFFTKVISGNLAEVKAFTGNGLFTSDTDDMDWQLAHKLLMPAFSSRAIKAYQVEMGKVAQQTIKLLETFAPEEPVELITWTTNLTFETIGKIGFGYSFDILKDKSAPPHDFIEAMGYCLRMVFVRFKQPGFMKQLPIEQNRKFEEAKKLMHTIVDEVVAERKRSPDATNSEKDLLGFMLNARDEHNLGLSDENIRDQVITFLIAGHETTSATLSFSFYEIARNKEIQQKVLQEIANAGITHDKLPTSEQIGKLKYIRMLVKECLRLYTPVGNLNRYCLKDCILPGGYLLKKDSTAVVNLRSMHWSDEVYPDAMKFDPERWTPEEEQKRNRFSWLPFSNGVRSCIGMAFAYQEILTVLSMVLSKFEIVYDGPPISRDVDSPTTRPFGFFVNIRPRTNMPEPNGEDVYGTAAEEDVVFDIPKDVKVTEVATPILENPAKSAELPPVTFLFGTQTGTSQDYASQLAKQAKGFGFKNVTLCQMDRWKALKEGKYDGPKDKLGLRELVVVCTATYNGLPPDSAENFDLFLDNSIEQGENKALDGLLYTVFGCGNKNWRTYQSFPKKIDSTFEELGAERFFPAGQGNADGDIDSQFQEWSAHFWVRTLQYFRLSTSSPSNPIVHAAPVLDGSDIKVKLTYIKTDDDEKFNAAKNNQNTIPNATVLAIRELHNKQNSDRSTCHIEIDVSKVPALSDQYLYQPGDHLEIMPANDENVVRDVALGFGLVLDAAFEINPECLEEISSRSLAAVIKGPCTVRNALTYYADILSPPSRSMLGIFATQLQKTSPETAATFEKLTAPDNNGVDQYPDFIKKYRTLLDLQEGFPQVNQLDLGQFLAAVTVVQPRRYSIASSPSIHNSTATIAVGVVTDSINDKQYPGLASTYLSKLEMNAPVRASFKSSKNTFGLPEDHKVPLILVAAGTGLAPFMGFLQERSLHADAAPCVVYFGCRHPDQDYIYREELAEFVDSKVISKLNVVHSRFNPNTPQKYVQHTISSQAPEVWQLLNGSENNLPASVYVCGAGNMSRDVRIVFETMAVSFGAVPSKEEAKQFIDQLIDERRYNEDTWA